MVRYVNAGVTLGSVNLPEVNLRSLTMDEPNHARVIYIHHNVPGVLRQGDLSLCLISMALLIDPVNEILGDHNVDKQITDNKGDVRRYFLTSSLLTNREQVAYLMADISNVLPNQIKEISDSLESLSCEFFSTNPWCKKILTQPSSHCGTHSVLI